MTGRVGAKYAVWMHETGLAHRVGSVEWDGGIVHPASQDGVHFKAYELLLVFSI